MVIVSLKWRDMKIYVSPLFSESNIIYQFFFQF